jgi:pimeloyl-ACP methyl ester carboxylesterase
MRPLPDGTFSRYVLVDGIRTHYLEAGTGRRLVLLHDGGFGGSARLTWFMNIGALSNRYHVIAPDWLGFGETDKIYDFGGNRGRRLRHMTRFLETVCVDEAAFIGCSMGATLLLQVAATGEEPWPIAALVSVSGGGFVPLNDARKRALSFDCTLESMRTVVSTYVHQRQWLDDPRMVAERFTQAISPGAWEAVAAARFKSPLAPGQRDFGAEDVTPYAKIAVPAMLAAGCHDVLREPNYAAGVAAAIPNVVLRLFEHSGHLPNIEEADDFNRHVLEFLAVHYPP